MSTGKQHLRGRARGAIRNRFPLFEEPIWEERLERLVRFTTRTETLIKLTGTDVRPARMKDHVDRIYAEFGEKPRRPRGVGKSFSSQGFLATKFERFDAAYLCALHFGARGSGEFSEVDSDLGRACDKMIEVYTLYSSLYPIGEARLSFDTYDVLIDGVRSRAIELHHCRECGSWYPWPADSINQPACSVCAVMDLRMSQARRELEARLQVGNMAPGTSVRRLAQTG